MRALTFSAFILLVLAACVLPASATPQLDISAGRSITAYHRCTDVAFLDLTTATRETDGVQWQPDITLGWVDGRHTQVYHLKKTVWVGGAGVRLVHWWRRAFFSFQLGATSARTDALSSTPEFVSSLGWQASHWQVMVRHISNGHVFGGMNLGETMLMVGVRL